MDKVLITGGNGLLGTHLAQLLLKNGYETGILSRDKFNAGKIKSFVWNPGKKEIEKGALEGVDYIIHLAGANLSEKRWTEERKKIIIDSRVRTAELLFQEIQKNNISLKAFISASAIGYYGTDFSAKSFEESDPPGKDFLAETCRLWESASDKFTSLGVRTVQIRTGIVLSKDGGALKQMLLPAKFGLGSALGSGKQYFPWIHIDDLCNIYLKAIEDDQMIDSYNAVAPDSINNLEFSRTLSRIMKKPFFLPKVPGYLLKLVYGEMAEMILTGNKISADKIVASGFTFLYPELTKALTDLLQN